MQNLQFLEDSHHQEDWLAETVLLLLTAHMLTWGLISLVLPLYYLDDIVLIEYTSNMKTSKPPLAALGNFWGALDAGGTQWTGWSTPYYIQMLWTNLW